MNRKMKLIVAVTFFVGLSILARESFSQQYKITVLSNGGGYSGSMYLSEGGQASVMGYTSIVSSLPDGSQMVVVGKPNSINIQEWYETWDGDGNAVDNCYKEYSIPVSLRDCDSYSSNFGGNCVAAFNFSFTIEPYVANSPLGSSPSPGSYCVNQNISLTAPSGYSSYTWYYKIQSGTWVAFLTTASPSISTSATAIWGNNNTSILNQNIHFAYAAGGCDPNSISPGIRVQGPYVFVMPSPTFSIGSSIVCAGSTGRVYMTESGMSNYVWSVSGGTITSGGGSSDNSVTVSWPTAGSGSVSVNYTNALGCTASNPTVGNVAVIALPTRYDVSGGGSYCGSSGGVNITLSSSQVGVNYQLLIDGAGYGSPVAGTGSMLTWASQTIPGTYTISASVSSGSQGQNNDRTSNPTSPFLAVNPVIYCYQNMNGSATITANPLPSKYNVGGGGSYCIGDAGAKITLSGSDSGINYQLMLNGTNIGSPIAGATGQGLTWSNKTGGGVYTVIATNASTGCSQPMNGSATISTYPSPTQFTVGGGGTYCEGSSGVNVTLSSSESGVNYQLLSGNPVGAPLAGTTGQGLTWPNLTSAGTYQVMATNTTTGCQQMMNSSATINIGVSGITISFTPVNYSCAFKFNATLNAPNTCSAINYTWTFGDNTTSTEKAPLHAFPSAGTYTVSLKVHFNCGVCKPDIVTQQTVTYDPLTDSFQDQVVQVMADVKTDILSASVSTFSNSWPLQHIDPNLSGTNTFLNGTSGVWRNDGNYVYKVPRSQSSSPDISKDGTFTMEQFNWQQAQYDAIPNWIKTNTMTQYSPFSYELENQDVLGVYSAALYDYGGHLPSANGVNMRNNEMAFTSFEFLDGNASGNWVVGNQTLPTYTTYRVPSGYGNVAIVETRISDLSNVPAVDVRGVGTNELLFPAFHVLFNYLSGDAIVCRQVRATNHLETVLVLNQAPFDKNWVGSIIVKNQIAPIVTPQIDNSIAHSGKSSLHITTPQTYQQGLLQLDSAKSYFINAWVSVNNPNVTIPKLADNLGIDLVVKDRKGVIKSTFSFQPVGPVIEGWQQVKGTFTCPINHAQLEITFKPGSTGQAWYDDLRLHPQQGNMKSYVYDLNDYRLTATLDEENFASFYFYDKEGNLYLVKKETEKGVKTISENVSFISSK